METNQGSNNSKYIIQVAAGVFFVFLIIISGFAGLGFIALKALESRKYYTENVSTFDEENVFYDDFNEEPFETPKPSVNYPDAKNGDKGDLLIIPKNNPVAGSIDTANVAVIQFADYDCPACQNFLKISFPTLETNYILNGKIIYSYKDLPLESLHPNAIVKANAARCAVAQNKGKYFEFLHAVIAITETNQASLIVKIIQTSNDYGYNQSQLESCVNNKQYYSEIRSDVKEALKFGIKSTPTFLIGSYDKNSNLVSGEILTATSYDQIQKIVEKYLSK